MRYAFVLVALLCGAASAQVPPCLPGGPCLPGYSVVANSLHYEEVLATDWKSRHGYWKVEDAAGQRTWYAVSCAEGHDCNLPKWIVYQISMMVAPEADKRRIQQVAYTENITYTCDADTAKRTDFVGRVCRDRDAVRATHVAAWEKLLPPEVRWTVKPLSGKDDRPVQKISAANGLATTTERIAVGKPCYPAVRTFVANTANTYMAIDPLRSDRVAVCVKG
jgi:hypothetical protein